MHKEQNRCKGYNSGDGTDGILDLEGNEQGGQDKDDFVIERK